MPSLVLGETTGFVNSAEFGFTVAKLAVEAGAIVLIGGRSESRLTRAAQKLPGSKTHPVDVSDEARVAAFFEHVGELDHLVVTAGGIIKHQRFQYGPQRSD